MAAFDSRLVLVEGMPGAGKTSIARFIGAELGTRGRVAAVCTEDDPENPIVLPNQDLGLAAVISSFAKDNALLPSWTRVPEQCAAGTVLIVESRFWQNSLMFMLIAGHPVANLLEAQAAVLAAIRALSPSIVWLDQQSSAALNAVARARKQAHPEWSDHVSTAFRSHTWFARRPGATIDDFYAEWRGVAQQLFTAFQYPKCQVIDPHEDWSAAKRTIVDFLTTGCS